MRSLEGRCAEADVVCAEDSGMGKLLAHFGIEAARAAGRGDDRSRAAGVVERVAARQVVAYCSDAGMPGVSGQAATVAAAREDGDRGGAARRLGGGLRLRGLEERYAALLLRRLLPTQGDRQRTVLAELSRLDAARVLRARTGLLAALSVIARCCRGAVAVCRELTKLHGGGPGVPPSCAQAVRGPCRGAAAFAARSRS